MSEAVSRIAAAIVRDTAPESELVLIGVRHRGVPLAQRIGQRIEETTGGRIPVGTLDITLYRDDLGHTSRWPVLRGTDIPFPIEDRRVVLVDDVLFTGRTVRAAIDSLCDLGRPAVIRLAVLIDRGHREFPIQADFVGSTLETEFGDRVNVRLVETDGSDEVLLL